MTDRLEGFILTRQWRDARDGIEFEFWLATSEGPARVIVTGQEPVFFVERSSEGIAEARREPLELKNFAGRPADGLYFHGDRARPHAGGRRQAECSGRERWPARPHGERASGSGRGRPGTAGSQRSMGGPAAPDAAPPPSPSAALGYGRAAGFAQP